MCEGLPWSSEKRWALKGVQHDARGVKLPKWGCLEMFPSETHEAYLFNLFLVESVMLRMTSIQQKICPPLSIQQNSPLNQKWFLPQLEKIRSPPKNSSPPLNLKNPPSRKKNPPPVYKNHPSTKKNVPLPITKKSPLNLQQSSHNQKGDLSFMWGDFFQSTKSINQ